MATVPHLSALSLADSWSYNAVWPFQGWACGDLRIEAYDPLHYRVVVAATGDEVFSGEIPPSTHADLFPAIFEAGGDYEIPSNGLEAWLVTVQDAADEARERRHLAEEGARLVAEEKLRSKLGLIDLAEVMRSGVTEPEMHTPLFIRGELHLPFGTKGSGKTLVVMLQALEVMQAAETVIWVDKEMGRRNIADRFKCIGGIPQLVEAWTAEHHAFVQMLDDQLVYLEYPYMDRSPVSVELWNGLLAERKPGLVVVDAQTEVLADADLNENSGTDVEKWQSTYSAPARRLGCTVVIIDHTGHEDASRAVSSRQKGAMAKVEYAIRRAEPFSRWKVGVVEIETRKNTMSALAIGEIGDVRKFRIGGTPLVFEEITADPLHAALAAAEPGGGGKSGAYFRIRNDIVALLDRPVYADGLTRDTILDLVSGATAEKRRALTDLAAEQVVLTKPGSRANSVLYFRPSRPPDSGATSSPTEGGGGNQSGGESGTVGIPGTALEQPKTADSSGSREGVGKPSPERGRKGSPESGTLVRKPAVKKPRQKGSA